MLINNIDELKAIIPTIVGTNLNSLENYSFALDSAECWLRTAVLGRLFEKTEHDSILKGHCSAIVAFAAYAESIPKLDLINTTNGFGVVGGGTSNLVPASRDRVNALIDSVKASLRMAEAQLYEYLEDAKELIPEWSIAPGSTILPQSLIRTKRAFDNYGRFDGGYDEWRRSKPKHRIVISNYIAPVLSTELTCKLVSDGDQQSEPNAKIIEDVRLSFASYFNGDDASGYSLIMAVLRYVRENIDQYPEYKNSSHNQPRTKAESTVSVGIFC